MQKVQAFASVRYDDYLAHHDVDVDMLIKVVKVYLDEQDATREAERLNSLKPEHPSRYWVAGTKLVSRVEVDSWTVPVSGMSGRSLPADQGGDAARCAR